MEQDKWTIADHRQRLGHILRVNSSLIFIILRFHFIHEGSSC